MKCGNSKSSALDQCSKCGFMPSSPDDRARSLILSESIFDFQSDLDIHEIQLPASPKDLEDIGRRIERGEEYQIDERLLRAVAKKVNEATQFGHSLTWAKVVFLFLLPLFLAIFVLIYAIKIIYFS